MRFRMCRLAGMVGLCAIAMFLTQLQAQQNNSDTTQANLEEQVESTLEIAELTILDSRDGYAIPEDSLFLPGETVHLYLRIKGYLVNDEYRILLRYQLEALDPAGRKFYIAEEGKVDVEVAPQDENWRPVIRYSPVIPEHAGGGHYLIRIEVEDVFAGQTLNVSMPILVEGTQFEESNRLRIRNFRFSKIEDGVSLEMPNFRPGEEIWASFFITGYKTTQDNKYDVESDAWVLDEEGNKLFAFESKGDAGNPFYPRFWLPARIRLDLDKNIQSGNYTVVVRLHDRIGMSSATEEYSFLIN